MTQPLEWAGNARGKIIDYGLSEFDSGAVAVSIKLAVQDYFDPDSKQWMDCLADGYETGGDIWIVKKDGTVNDRQVQSLCEYCGWDGDLLSIANGTWRPTPCAVVVNSEKYKDEIRYRISFVNPFDRVPGQVGNVAPEKIQRLQDAYGDKFRALAGNAQRNSAPPSGRPPAPKKAPGPAGCRPANAPTSNPPQQPAAAAAPQESAASDLPRNPNGTIQGANRPVAPAGGDDIPF